MNSGYSRNITVVITLLTLGIYAVCMGALKDSEGEAPRSNSSINIDVEFMRMVKAKGMAYKSARDDLLSAADSAKTWLNENMQRLTSEEDILCARILETRLEKPLLAAKVDDVIQNGIRYGTRKGENDISPIYLQSEFVRMGDNPVLLVLEHIIYIQEDPLVQTPLLQAVAVFKDDDLRVPLKKLLRETEDPLLRMGVIDAIQRADFTDLIPEVVSLYGKTDNKLERRRILRAARTIGRPDLGERIKSLLQLERDSELKEQIEETYKSLQEKQQGGLE